MVRSIVLGMLLGAIAVACVGCASSPAPRPGPAPGTREIVMAYDDARATGTLAFPTQTYESVVRFELPQGEHRPLRLRFQAEAAGQLEIAIYDSTVLETCLLYTSDAADERSSVDLGG